MAEQPGWIDVHAHFTTERYIAEASASGHAMPDGMAGYPAWSARQHVDLMDANGIATAVLSMSSPGVHFGDDAQARALARHVNEEGALAAREHPHRFSLFASLPLPDVDGAADELAYAMDHLGAVGAVLESNAHGQYLGDRVLGDLLAELDRRQGILFIHPTSPPCAAQVSIGRPRPMIEFLFDTARTVTDLVLAGVPQRFPDLPIIVPHAGGVLPLVADRIQGFMGIFGDPDQPKPQVHRDLAGLYYDLAGDPFPRLVPALLTITSPDHVLYGSDYPWTPAPGVTRRLEAITADSPGWQATTTATARRLLDRRNV